MRGVETVEPGGGVGGWGRLGDGGPVAVVGGSGGGLGCCKRVSGC